MQRFDDAFINRKLEIANRINHGALYGISVYRPYVRRDYVKLVRTREGFTEETLSPYMKSAALVDYIDAIAIGLRLAFERDIQG